MSERRQERKVVTVLFCDLVGFTQRAEEMDPEDVASLLGPYQAHVKQELERHGGTVEKFIGDAVMAVFGAPTAHEDDPERAVRAAFAIRDFATEEGIELRIGITTGEALVTLGARPDLGEAMATGDVVNTAARLQAAAPVNGILVSAKTYAATKDAIEYRDAEPVEAKGKTTPVSVREAVRARGRIAVDRLHTTPLVGRDRELDQLVDSLGRARAERQPQLVTLVGVPGIGKSRLVYELSHVAESDSAAILWRQGRCLPYGDGVTFWALGEIVKSELGIMETDSAQETEHKLGHVDADEWVQQHIRPLVGLSVDGVGEGDRREEAFVAWRRFLEGIAAERPLVVVFEDLHWADESLLDFVDHLVDWSGGVALLVVCTARPELFERRPGWGGGKTNALTVSLAPLSDEEATRLVAGLAPQTAMPAETQLALLAHAGGNPLYAEQYARLLEEGTTGELQLPETVQGIIAARIDLLDAQQKALLQDAAVLGDVFWLGALALVARAEHRAVELCLHALERKGFVRRERDGSIEGDTEYAFLHVVVRDVAYGQIPRVPRSEKHRLAAEWIESLGRAEDHAGMRAHHYREALDLARAAGLDARALELPARRALRGAGDRAMAVHAYGAALRFYEQALELWPEADIERARLLFERAKAEFLAAEVRRPDLLVEAKTALFALGDREAAAEAAIFEAMALREIGAPHEALDSARTAAAWLEDATASSTKAWVIANWARYLFLDGGLAEAMDFGRQALAMAGELGLEDVRASALTTIGMARMGVGDLDGIKNLEESLASTIEHGSPLEICRTQHNLGLMYWHVGQVERGTKMLAARVEADEQFGLTRRFGIGIMAPTSWLIGRWDEAERYVDAFLADPLPHELEPMVRSIKARLRLARNDVSGAGAESVRMLELMADRWDAPGPLVVPVTCARVAVAAGRPAEAGELVDRALALFWRPPYQRAAPLIDFTLLLTELGFSCEAILDLARESPGWPWPQVAAAVARGELVESADRLVELSVPTLEAAVRSAAAARLIGEGRRAEADEQLRKALAFYRSVGAIRDIREAEALLAAV